jgi:F0F1-type ATP synthase membrane subunit c/vacuolar-type H+-ATPase subunit K
MKIQKLSAGDIQKAFTPDFQRIMLIIHLAIATGAASFAGIIIFIYTTSAVSAAGTQNDSTVGLLTKVHLGIAAVFFPLAMCLFSMIIKNKLNKNPEMDAMEFLISVRTASIIRLAIMESAAFFGLVVCLMAVSDNIMRENPFYWINAVPAVFLIGFILLNIPDSDRIGRIYSNIVNS